MTSRPSLSTVKKNLRALSPGPFTPEAMDRIVAEMHREHNDRGTALIGASVIEMMLTNLLHMHFLDLKKTELSELFDRDNSPIGNFSAKTKISYAMGLISVDERNEIDLIRHIRNAFAHTTQPITFYTTEVYQACEHLNFIRPAYKERPFFHDNPKLWFIESTVVLSDIGLDQTNAERSRKLHELRRRRSPP